MNSSNSYTKYPQGEITSTREQGRLRTYLKHGYWYLLSLVAMLITGLVYIWITEPIYQIQASLLVKDEPATSLQTTTEGTHADDPNTVIDNELEILKSNSLLKKVIDTLGLNVRYFRDTPFGKREVYEDSPLRLILQNPTANIYRADLHIGIVSPTFIQLNDRIYPANRSISTPFGQLQVLVKEPVDYANEPLTIQVMPDLEAIDYYQRRLTIEPSSEESTVLLLTAEDAVPARGEALLNQMIASYHSAATEDKSRMLAESLCFIQTRLKVVAGEITVMERAVEQYKTSHRVADVSAKARLLLNSVQSNDAQLSQIAIQRSTLRDVEQYVRHKQTGLEPVPATLEFSDPTLIALIGKVRELELQRDRLAGISAESNPIVQSLDRQIAFAKSSIAKTAAILRTSLTNEQNQLRLANRQYDGQIGLLPEKDQKLTNNVRQCAIKNSLHTYLLQKQEEVALSYAALTSASHVIDAATRSPEPIKPVKALVLLAFGLVGLVVPTAVISVARLFNKRIAERGQIGEATAAPVMGEIAYIQYKWPLIVDGQKRSVAAEQIRALRTNLQLLRKNPADSQVLLLTSSLSGEGKSFLALNLAASMALVGRSTVLVDLDLRRPRLHAMMHALNFQGSSSYLAGEANLINVIQQVPGFEHLNLISGGPVLSNPSELLSGPRLGELIAELRLRFDHVVIDSPPVGLVTDAQLIGPFADVTLYTVRQGVTPLRYLKLIDSLYQENRFPKLNIVFNSVQDTYWSGDPRDNGQTTGYEKSSAMRSHPVY
ncbi:GumC family protein [Larkinella insperata]|uniref:GumC family protein n=1 Tax=Larkinella insperata TaxID=332158 RepID=A0ABW3QGA3_9BACT|nr:tyrosine-protein kinase [Larkinella insperata]